MAKYVRIFHSSGVFRLYFEPPKDLGSDRVNDVDYHTSQSAIKAARAMRYIPWHFSMEDCNHSEVEYW